MRKLIVALGMTSAVCLSTAAVALADGSPPPTQAVTQSAGTAQQAGALSSAQQVNPQNINVSIRINSPGDNGDVTQTNSVGSQANAGNLASTTQNAGQPAAASKPWWPVPTPSPRSSAWGPSSGTSTTAPSTDAGSTGQSTDPGSTGQSTDPGSTGQSNDAGSGANSGNAAGTQQGATQSPSTASPSTVAPSTSCGCGGSNGGVQSVDQSAGTQQTAVAASKAVQVDPSNENVSIRINSPGNDGNVTQTNSVTSAANAGNAASTEQHASQASAGANCGCDAVPVSQPTLSTQPDSSDPAANSAAAPATSSAPSVQSIQQDAGTGQTAIAGSTAVQQGASNADYPVRINSKGDNGDVTQSNTVSSAANAGNAAWTKQRAGQSGGSSCGCGGTGIQAIGQKAETAQGALALSGAIQQFGDGKPSRCGCGGSDGGAGNTASPVRIGSPGTDGSLTQTNSVDSSANAGNKAGTSQNASQQAGGGGLQIQALGQEAGTLQGAFAGSLAAQFGASNEWSPVRVWSPGGGDSVSQTNSATSQANAGNAAWTGQTGNQAIGGPLWRGCECHTLPIQAIGQQAETGQLAGAGSAAFQLDPKNSSTPVRVGSWGGYGSFGQQNTSGSQADGGGLGGTDQSASQLT
jgi:hypothetical protein